MKHCCWEIGTYAGSNSICVNYYVDFELRFHRHDYGGVSPRWMRIGKAIEEIENEINKQEKLTTAWEQTLTHLTPKLIETFKLMRVYKGKKKRKRK